MSGGEVLRGSTEAAAQPRESLSATRIRLRWSREEMECSRATELFPMPENLLTCDYRCSRMEDDRSKATVRSVRRSKAAMSGF